MKSKIVAAVLAFFLGGLGIHRFYLGETGKGIFYLLFCWTFIPSVIAFIDGILFLTMNENIFNVKYNTTFTSNQVPTQQPMVVINNNVNQGVSEPNKFTPKTNDNFSANDKEEDLSTISTARKIDPFEKDGDRLYEDYDFDGAIEMYLKSLNVNSNNTHVHFNLSKLYSILEKTDQSLFHLNSAIEKGFYDFDEILNHDHLAYLRSQPQFVNFKSNGYKPVKAISAPQSDGLDISDSIISQIERLAKLRDEDIITDEDFVKQKNRLFGH